MTNVSQILDWGGLALKDSVAGESCALFTNTSHGICMEYLRHVMVIRVLLKEFPIFR